jgi:organic hydroperoxide reductase OsmC/OhrA
MVRNHHYDVSVEWTGNLGTGTDSYHTYSRSHVTHAPGKPDIDGSADAVFRGDTRRWAPEDLLIAAVSACHMLWYLHLAADAGVVITDYVDRAHGVLAEETDGGGQMVDVVLRPLVTVADPSMVEPAGALHSAANAKCFIARSLNFPVRHEPQTRVREGSGQTGAGEASGRS